MGKVLYTAYDAQGREKRGFIEALSNQDALKRLHSEGLEQIRLHSDAALGHSRDDLEGISQKELERIAAFELKIQQGVGLGMYTKEVLRNNVVPMFISALMFGYGYSEASWGWMASAVIVSSALPFFSFWNYGVMSIYNRAQKSLAFGEWEKLKEEATHFKNSSQKNPDFIVEADTMLATYHAKKGDMDQALSLLLPHKEYLEGKSSGTYENKLGSLYVHAKAYEKACYTFKQAYEVSRENMMLADWALAEARFGDITLAKENILSVSRDALPTFGVPFVDLVEGLIAYKSHSFEDAKYFFTSALEGFSTYDTNPATWTALAMVNIYLALTMHALGEEVDALLQEGVVQIAKEHADDALLVELKRNFPDHF